MHTLCSLQCFRPDDDSVPGDDSCQSVTDWDLINHHGHYNYTDVDRSVRLHDAVDALGGLLAGRLVEDVGHQSYHPDDRVYCSRHAGGTGDIFIEDAFVRSLTLYRNSLGGSIVTGFGKYHVLAVTNAVLGVCLDAGCRFAAAVDTTRSSPLVATASATGHVTTPIVALAGSTNGIDRPVSMGERTLLSLGRGVLQDAAWLGPAFGLDATIRLANDVPVAVRRLGVAGITFDRGMAWRLDGSGPPTGLHGASLVDETAAGNGTTWLAGVAAALCDETVHRPFVDTPTLCARAAEKDPEAHYRAERAARTAYPDRINDDWEHVLFRERPTRTRSWTVHPQQRATIEADVSERLLAWDVGGRTPPPPGETTSMAGLYPLAGRGMLPADRGPRELSTASTVEVTLAAALQQRLVQLPGAAAAAAIAAAAPDAPGSSRASAVRDGQSILRTAHRRVEDEVSSLSQVYDQAVWAVDAPAEPVSVGDMALAALISLPEVGGLFAMWLTTRVAAWDVTRVSVFGLLFGLGVTSLADAWRLVSSDRAGAAWRTAARRSALHARLPRAVDDALEPGVGLAGTVIVQLESVLLIGRDDYRPVTTTLVASGLTALYAVVAAPLLVRVLWVLAINLRRKRERELAEQQERETLA